MSSSLSFISSLSSRSTSVASLPFASSSAQYPPPDTITAPTTLPIPSVYNLPSIPASEATSLSSLTPPIFPSHHLSRSNLNASESLHTPPLQPPFSLDAAGATEMTDKLAVSTQRRSETLISDTFKTSSADTDTVAEPFTIPTMPINVYAAQSSVREESSVPSNSTSSTPFPTVTIVGATVGGITLLLVGLFVWLFLRRRHHRSKNKDVENLRWHMVQSRNVTEEDMNAKVDLGDVIDIRPLPCTGKPRTPTQENPFLSDDEDGSETPPDSRRGSAASSIHFARLPNTPISSSFAVTQTGHYAPRQTHRQSQSKDLDWTENQTSLMSVLEFMKQKTEAQRR